jgi:hypothetical protein
MRILNFKRAGMTIAQYRKQFKMPTSPEALEKYFIHKDQWPAWVAACRTHGLRWSGDRKNQPLPVTNADQEKEFNTGDYNILLLRSDNTINTWTTGSTPKELHQQMSENWDNASSDIIVCLPVLLQQPHTLSAMEF